VHTVYSTYEAKAKLAEIIRRVRAGARVTITHRGQAVAEVRPIETPPLSLASRLESLAGEGRIVQGRGRRTFRTLARRPGSLARFLSERE
jgi:prevent-host-death family protein